jgi:hypothetical protein
LNQVRSVKGTRKHKTSQALTFDITITGVSELLIARPSGFDTRVHSRTYQVSNAKDRVYIWKILDIIGLEIT